MLGLRQTFLSPRHSKFAAYLPSCSLKASAHARAFSRHIAVLLMPCKKAQSLSNLHAGQVFLLLRKLFKLILANYISKDRAPVASSMNHGSQMALCTTWLLWSGRAGRRENQKIRCTEAYDKRNLFSGIWGVEHHQYALCFATLLQNTSVVLKLCIVLPHRKPFLCWGTVVHHKSPVAIYTSHLHFQLMQLQTRSKLSTDSGEMWLWASLDLSLLS